MVIYFLVYSLKNIILSALFCLKLTDFGSLIAQIKDSTIIFEGDDDHCTLCEPEIRNLKNEVSLYDQKVADASKVFYETLISNLKKDITIHQLKKKLLDNVFNDFTDVLPPVTIDVLNGIDGSAANDSNFILNAMKGVYSEDLSRLKNKTFAGRKKDALTPKKKETIRKVYMKRIDLHEKDEANAVFRKSNFGKHMNNAINNINVINKHDMSK